MDTPRIEIKAEDSVIHLRAGQIAIIRRPLGVTITCTSGAAWLTQGNTTRDFVLYNRDRLLLDRRARVVVEALFDCSLRVETSPAATSIWARIIAPVQRWGQRLARAAAVGTVQTGAS